MEPHQSGLCGGDDREERAHIAEQPDQFSAVARPAAPGGRAGFPALEQRAAADLSKVRIETAVDRSHLVRLGWVLAAVLAVFIGDGLLSPKNPFRSAARVLWPWAAIEAPTRVTIREVLPGDARVFHGESVKISADIAGLRESETPLLVYSTADGQTVDQSIPLTRSEGYRYQCGFPPGNSGLQQDCQYYLAAGDCRTGRFTIHARIPPSIVVDRVTYRYPAYTGLRDRTVEGQGQGDLRAIENTAVTIHAVANTDISPATAKVNLGCTGRTLLLATAKGRECEARFTLQLSAEDPSRSKYEFYQLRFCDLDGQENIRPAQHRIEVLPDLPPEVQFLEPQRDDVAVAADGEINLKVRASDPDFGLRRVTLHAECGDRDLGLEPLLELPSPRPPYAGDFQHTYAFQPALLGLKPGDRVRYWADAEDNKEPAANKSETTKRWIKVLGGSRRPGKQDNRDGARGGESPDGTAGQPGGQPGAGGPSAEHPNPDGNPQEPGENDAKDPNRKPPATPADDWRRGDDPSRRALDPKRESPDKHGKDGLAERSDDRKRDTAEAEKRVSPNGEMDSDAIRTISEDAQRHPEKDKQPSAGRKEDQKPEAEQKPEQEQKPAKQTEPKPPAQPEQPNQPSQEQKRENKPNRQKQSSSEKTQPNGQQSNGEQGGGQKESSENRQTGGGQSKAGDEQSGQKNQGGQKSAGQQQKEGEQNGGQSGQSQQGGDKSQRNGQQHGTSQPQGAKQQGDGAQGSHTEKGTEKETGAEQNQPNQAQQGEKGNPAGKADKANPNGAAGGARSEGRAGRRTANTGLQRPGKPSQGNGDSGPKKPGGGQASPTGGAGGEPSSGQRPDQQPGGGSQGNSAKQGAENGPSSGGSTEAGEKPGGSTEAGEPKDGSQPKDGGQPSGGTQQPDKGTASGDAREKPGSDATGGRPSGTKTGGDRPQPTPGEPSSGHAPPTGQGQATDRHASPDSGGQENPSGQQAEEKPSEHGTGGDVKPAAGNPAPANEDRPHGPGGAGIPKKSGEENPEESSAGAPASINRRASTPLAAIRTVRAAADTATADTATGASRPAPAAPSPICRPNRAAQSPTSPAAARSASGRATRHPANRPTAARKPREWKGRKGRAVRLATIRGKPASRRPPEQRQAKARSRRARAATRPPRANRANRARRSLVPRAAQTSPGKAAAHSGSGNAVNGANPDNSVNPTPIATAAGDADEPKIDYARRQTELALEHLRHEASKEKSPLLDRLGWSKDDANRFLARWQEMSKAAGQKGRPARRPGASSATACGASVCVLAAPSCNTAAWRPIGRGRSAPAMPAQPRPNGPSGSAPTTMALPTRVAAATGRSAHFSP